MTFRHYRRTLEMIDLTSRGNLHFFRSSYTSEEEYLIYDPLN